MKLSTKMKQQLKAKAHALRPIILIGNNGITPAVLKETDRALNDHEIIKIRLQSVDKKTNREIFKDFSKQLNAEPIQLIGHIGVMYRVRVES